MHNAMQLYTGIILSVWYMHYNTGYSSVYPDVPMNQVDIIIVLCYTIHTSTADSSPEFQQRRQARERGGVARAHGNDCSRQSREHSHHSQHCNNTPHPH